MQSTTEQPRLARPSGRQYTIVYGQDRATVVEVGGGLRSYVAGGRELLDGYAEEEMASSGRGQVLAPWPNRLGDGAYDWDGATLQLALSEPARSNAIHGLVRFLPWTCRELTTSSVELEHLLHPSPGYPFSLLMRVRYRIDAEGLTVQTTAANVGDRPLPYASGQHPYLLSPTGRIDDCVVQAPGSTYLTTDDRGLPTGRRSVEGTEYDFRSGRRLGTLQVDLAFGDLERDEDGRAWVRLSADDGGAAVWAGSGYRHLQLFTGDTVAAHRRRHGLGVEPMTAPPDALRTGADLVRLEPGEEHQSVWGMCALAAEGA